MRELVRKHLNFDFQIVSYCCLNFNEDLNSIREVADKHFIDSDIRHKIRIFAKNPNKMPKIIVSAKAVFEEAIIIIGNGHSERLFLRLNGKRHLIYIGDGTKWHSVKGKVTLNNTANLLIGKGVSSQDLEANISGNGCIIGDDVMFAQSVKIRTHSGHGFINLSNGQFRTIENSLVIEPHVWVGEHVKIFNCKRIGSCSVIGYNSLVIKDVPKLHVAKGSPAVSSPTNELWVRSNKNRDIETAKLYFDNLHLFK